MVQKEKVEARIKREQAYQDKQAVGSEEYEASGKRLNELHKLLLEIETLEADTDRKNKQAVEDIIKTAITLGVDLGKVVVVYVIGFQATKVILTWESTGVVTTMAKGWITKMLVPNKF